jgi:hypothetical protein
VAVIETSTNAESAKGDIEGTEIESNKSIINSNVIASAIVATSEHRTNFPNIDSS